MSGIDDNHIYTIFVSAMEINSTNSNSSTTDLLKLFTGGIDNDRFETPETCVEIEFDDARKTRRKLFDINKVPMKDHSTRLYTIRLVQAQKSDQTEVCIQIFLVEKGLHIFVITFSRVSCRQ